MCEPSSVGAIFTSVGSAFKFADKFADLAVRLAEVGSKNEVFVRTIHVVRDDLNEVERLLRIDSVQRKLASTPGKLSWISSAINNTNSALNEIGKWVERARAEQQSTGSIQFTTRVQWVFKNHEKILQNRKTELMACHQQLSNVLSYLIRLEDVPINAGPPTYQDATCFDEIISRHKRRSIWKASGNAQVSPETLTANEVHESSHTSDTPTGLKVTHLISSDKHRNSEAGHMAFDHSESVLKPSLSSSSEASCAYSPPPTYASAVQPSKTIQHPELDNKRHFDAETVEQNPVRPSVIKIDIERSSTADCRPQNTWIHQFAQRDSSVSELAGDMVCLSATNSYGPVNSYEYCTDFQSLSLRPLPKNDETEGVAELLGDLSFAVEVPGKDTGPPPGYASGSSRTGTHNPDCYIPASQIRVHEQRKSVPDLPAVPRRRPVPSHAFSEPVPTAHELPSAPSSPGFSTLPTEQLSVVGTTRQNVISPELHSMFQLQQGSRSLTPNQFHHACAQSSYSLSSASTGLVSGLPMGSSSAPHDMRVSSPDPVRSSGLKGRPMSFQSPEAGESASVNRMRRQKQMMDLLGSIG